MELEMKTQELPSLAGQKVLITGGLGFIGSNIAHKCVNLGAEVSIYDCLDPHSGGNIFNIESIIKSVTLYCNNILNFDRLSDVIQNQDIIINCAASTSHQTSMKEPWLDQNINSKGMLNLLEAIRRFNPTCKFIHLGTTTQLGKLQYQPADENHPEFPTDIYSANKTAAEKYALIYSNAHNLNITILRVSNVFGPRASIHTAEFTFNNFFIGLALQNKIITVFGDGNQKRNVIYVDDVVNGIILVSQNPQTNGEVFFLVGDEHYSVSEIAKATVKNMESGQFQLVPWPKGREKIDVGDAIISNKKLKDYIDWIPEYNLHNGLKNTRRYYINYLEKYLR
jgi:UDP-glucose 4-epimerase